MKATIYISGAIGKETTLIDVIRQFKAFENPESLDVYISSIGGDVDEGQAIYNYLKNIDSTIPVTTITNKAYSIAAQIFAAGRYRIVENVSEAIMIHFAWAEIQGNAEDFEYVASLLRKTEKEFSKFYSSFLNIDESAVTALLNNDTFISGKEALEIGFATEIKEPLKAVAEFNIKSNNKKMTEKKKSAGKKLLEAMAAFIGVEINAELILQDSTGKEIVFPDIEATDTPKVGDKATIDGAAAEGSFIMPSLDEATVVFVGGEITEMLPKEEMPAEAEPLAEEKPAEQPQASFEELLEKVTDKVTLKIEASYKAKLEAKENEIKELKKKIGSKEIVAELSDEQKQKPAKKKTFAEILRS